ncbi:hypothetical protein [Streptomyces sp. CBMA152]|uniref:hypothetical protein n=1 Tax=Streptomyces sp. CBMA152 TaxID=1896312 RepID=UPI001660B50D|nr:hypothetical protein [Streptomyces sp. CBMA152]MBD0742950.1 hypothetical protein [Streptomyces sp. CBMA152]
MSARTRAAAQPPSHGAEALCETVGVLHQAGWVNADLQPHHAIHTPGGVVQLIDSSWAWSLHLSPSYAFRGGLVHLLPPQLAATVENGARPVQDYCYQPDH